MNTAVPPKSLKVPSLQLPQHRDAFYGGKWHKAKSGRSADAINPGTGESLGAGRRLRRSRYRRRGRLRPRPPSRPGAIRRRSNGRGY